MASEETAAESGRRLGAWRVDPVSVGAWLLPAAFIVYLALKNGGYDEIPRSEAGIAIWWMLLIAAIVGVLPQLRLRSVGGVLTVLLAGFVAWTALSLSWTESAERTMIELARVATYAGFWVVGVALSARGYGRPLLNGTTAALGVVIALAALSRMEPNWFPEQNVGQFLPDIEIESRLAYPLNYSSGLAALCALGLPLLIAAASSGRTSIGRALAAAALPVAALTMWLTGSSLVLPLAAIALAVYFLLTDTRPAALATAVLGAVGGAILIVVAEARDALERGLTTSEALREGDELLVVTLVVCLAVAVGQIALGRAFRRWPRLEGPLISPRAARVALASAVVGLVVVGLAAGGGGKVSEQWEEFRSAEGLDPHQEDRGAQVLDVSARGRYQFWQAAINAYESEPLLGTGPGTFEFWWSREGNPDAAIFVREAHSLYFGTLAELGPLGVLLVIAFVVTVLAASALRAFHSPRRDRAALAAVASACFVFAAVATVDWVWELGVLPISFLFLAAVAVARSEEGGEGGEEVARAPRRTTGWNRVLVGAASLAALVAIAIPYAAGASVEESRDAVADGRLDDALSDAQAAVAVEPFASAPRLQEALVLEQLGRIREAIEAARGATDKEPTNWRPWVVLARLEARGGNPEGAVEAFREARSLFPRLIGT